MTHPVSERSLSGEDSLGSKEVTMCLLLLVLSLAQSSTEFTGLRESIQRSEYHYELVPDEPGWWSAPNRSQELRTRASVQGLEVFPRETDAHAQGAPWKLALSTTRFGRT